MGVLQYAFPSLVGDLRSGGFFPPVRETYEGHSQQETGGADGRDGRDPSLPWDCHHKPRDAIKYSGDPHWFRQPELRT